MADSGTVPSVPDKISYKIIYVKNIDETVSTTDISKLFGFHDSSFLRKNTCVEILAEEDERYAKVVLPDYVFDEVIKMNGLEFYNKKLIIEDEDAGDETATRSQNTEEEEDDEILYILLDCRSHPDLNFPTVKEFEVCDALNIDFGEDIHKAVKTMFGTNLGTFKIESDDMGQYVDKQLVIRGHKIDLVPVRKKKQMDRRAGHFQRTFEPNTVKVRIFDAWSKPYKSIDNQLFDEYFTNLGADIIKPTQPERCRERREVFTMNRYIVVRTVDHEGRKIDLGERVQVADYTFNISYFGKLHNCGLCRSRHGWHCPSQLRHDFLRKMRKGKTDKCKIYSDSTLRLTNQLALTTDVACMTGGGIGQLCNVIPYDSPHEEIIINAGTNELKCNDLAEFVFTVEKEKEKVQSLATSLPVTIVLPQISTDIPETKVKSQFLHNSFNGIDNVKVIQLERIEIDDGHGHPTAAGTIDILKQINVTNNIIMKDCLGDVISPQKYRCVQSLFKTGCRACESLEFTPFLCSSCKGKAKLADTSEIAADIKKLRDELFPPIEVEMVNVDNTSNGIKRSIEETDGNSNDGNTESKKPAKSS